jgi:hypothetical protein
MDLDRRVLLTAPWCWPPPQSRGRDLLVDALGPAPTLAPGRAPAVTVRGEAVTLWCLDVGAGSAAPFRDAPGFSRMPLGRTAQASWRAACLALPRSLPVLWRRVCDAGRDLPVGTFLRSHRDASGLEERERVLEGSSFGLTFFLQLATRVLDLPLPGDVLAVAAIDEHGRTSPVDALGARITSLATLAPSIRRIVVCASQAAEARAAAGDGIEIVSVACAADALSALLEGSLPDRLVAAGTDADHRAELVEAFFRQALTGRAAAIDWSPIERGATMALREWPLVDDQEYRLQFAAAVAARHDRGVGELPLPDEMTSPHAWLERQPAPVRFTLLTHLVRQSAEAGTPPWPKTEALAVRALPPRFEDALRPHLTLMAALARLWAITGREVTALVLDRRLARAFAEAFAEAEVAGPLAEIFRLAGVLHDRGAFEDADDLREQVLTAGGFGLLGAPHVELARARALLMLGRLDDAVLDTLADLARDPGAALHVRGSAARWFVRALRERRHDDSAAQQLARLEQEAAAAGEAIGAAGADPAARAGSAAPPGAIAERYVVLAHLDAAIAASDSARAATLIARLGKLDPGPVGHLLSVSRDPAYIATRYPR